MNLNRYTKLCISVGLLASIGGQANAQTPVSLPEKHGLGDTIVVAYGKLPAKAVTASVSTINQADIANQTVFTLGNALYGRIPGLSVLQRTSEPGEDDPLIFLRGRATTAENAPLILVDGIERDMSDVLPEDVASVTLLKDAASTVMYGIRGANGVILVTTKRGAGKLQINAKVEQGILQPTRIPAFVNSATFVKLYNQALANDGLDPLFSVDDIKGYEAGHSYFYPDVDWAKETLKPIAPATRANMNVSGGDDIASYYVSLGYYHNGGIYSNTDRNEGYSTNNDADNFSFRSNLDVNVNKNWSLSLDLGGRVYQKNRPISTSANIWDMIYQYPSHMFPAYVEDDVYGGTSIYPNNPIGYINSRGYRKINNRALYTTLSTKYDLSSVLDGLSIGARYSYDNFYQNHEGYTKEFLVRELLGRDASGGPVLSSPIGQNTSLTAFGPNTDAQRKRTGFEGYLEYEPQLNENHSLHTLVLYHQDRLIIGNESPYNYQFVSGRARYGYLNRYYAEVGGSYSGTEAFPKGNRFGFFPAMSFGWVVSEHDFLKDNNTLNFLKLRASAGSVGNAAVGERFSDLRQYISSTGYIFGNTNAGQSGLYPGVIANSGFRWETAYKYDIGVDAQLFSDLELGLTYFFQKRKDILVPENALVPDIFGGDLPNVNVGISHNQGFEGRLLYAKDKNVWGYHVGVNLTYVTDKLVHFPEAAKPHDYLYRAGHPVGQPFMLEAIGFFNSAEEIANSPVQSFGPVQPGDIRYKDQNNDGRIDDFDRIPIMNSTLPNWDAGLDLAFRYKNFDIGAFFQGQAGRSINLGATPILFWPLDNNSARISTYPQQFWTEETKNTADYPRLTTIDNQNNYRPSTQWYINGDFFRLRSLHLGYSLPEKVVQYAKLRSARIFLTGMNLFSVDHLKYTDPESQRGYPVMRSYNAGINLQF